jgi:hypothetical protein
MNNEKQTKKEIDRRYYLKHRQKILQRVADYYQKNKEKISEYKKKWWRKKVGAK